MMSDDSDQLDEDHEQAVQDFITKWNLSTENQNLLFGLDGASQLKVMHQFAPRDTSRDVNAIFMKFASGVANGVPQMHQQPDAGSEELRAFIEQWSLGPEAQQVLMGLMPQAKQRVLKEFAPRDTSRDANAIFIKFAQGIASGGKGCKGVGKGVPAPVQIQAYPGPQRGFAAGYPLPVPQPVPLPAYHAPYAVPAAQPQAAVAEPSLQAFIAKWQLQPEAQGLLIGLDPASQRKVMVEFAPRDTSRDVNAIFCKFAQGVGQRDRGAGAGAVKTFVAQWRLGPDAQALFFSMRPDVQQKVMQEFRPRDASSDVNNIFMKFAQGVARGGQARAAGAPAAGGYGGPRFSPY